MADVFVAKCPYIVHADGRGSVTTITYTSGRVVASYRYDAFGRPVQAANTIGNTLAYAGQAYDPTSGLDAMGVRTYDPATGRFLTPDPAGMAGSGTNLYAYAGDNPVTYEDPTGRMYGYTGGGGIGQSTGSFSSQSCGPSCETWNQGGSGGAETSAPYWRSAYCAVQDVVVASSILLAIIGIYADEVQLLQWSTALAASSAVLDAYKIISNPLDLVGNLGAGLDLIWALLNGYVFPMFNNVWSDMILGSEVAVSFTPPGLAAKWPIVGAISALGIAGLEMQGCGVPLS